MPPSYTANNAVYLSTTITNATITLVTPLAVTPVAPATATVLSFLAAAGNGPVTPQVIINYQDGTSETNILSIPDWGNTILPFVHLANGRIDVDSAQINDVKAVPLPRFMLFNRDLVLTKTTSAITSISLNYTNTGGRISIFAVSASTAPVLPFFLTTMRRRRSPTAGRSKSAAPGST